MPSAHGLRAAALDAISMTSSKCGAPWFTDLPDEEEDFGLPLDGSPQGGDRDACEKGDRTLDPSCDVRGLSTARLNPATLELELCTALLISKRAIGSIWAQSREVCDSVETPAFGATCTTTRLLLRVMDHPTGLSVSTLSRAGTVCSCLIRASAGFVRRAGGLVLRSCTQA